MQKLKSHRSYLTTAIIISCNALIFTTDSFAASYQSFSTSAIDISNASAGAAADKNNLASIAINPALSAQLNAPKLAISTIFVKPSSEVTGNYYSAGNADKLDNEDVGKSYMIPAAYFAMPINKTWSIGLAAFSNYNSKLEYENNYVAGLAAGTRELFTYEINPHIAYRIGDVVSIGFGVSHIYGSYEVTTNYGDQNNSNREQNYLDYEGSGNDLRFNIGLYYQYTQFSQFGLSYKTGTKIETSGALRKYSRINKLIFNANATSNITIPSELVFSGLHKVDKRLTLLYSFSRYGWSEQKNTEIKNSGCNPDASFGLSQGQCLSEEVSASDSFRLAMAMNYKLNDITVMRSGLAYEQNTDSQTFANPFDQKHWFSFGFSFNVSRRLSFDIGFAYAFYEEHKQELTIASNSYQITNSGNDIVAALQLNYRFLEH